MNFLRIQDLVTFRFTDQAMKRVADSVNQFQPQLQGSQTTGLHVSIAATHSGVITRNNGFYLPEKMKRGTGTFTENYGKPVLIHHQEHADPIGRIIDAGYVDTSGSIKDKWDLKQGIRVKNKTGREIGVLNETLLTDFVDGRLPFGMAVDTVCSILRDTLLQDGTFEGLGYIQLVANIVNKDAITKLLDGRYLTGSVGATTDKAICSVCRQDWTESGKCAHQPGAIYDEGKCFIIAGNLVYDEYSFVNIPADRHSRVLQLNYNGLQDNIEIANPGKVYESAMTFPQFTDSGSKETLMTDKTETSETVQSQIVIADQAVPVIEKVPVVEQATVPVVNTTESKKEESDTLSTLMDLVTLTDEQSEQLYEFLWAEVEAAVKDGEITTDQVKDMKVEKLEDAKLSTEKRKKLAKSTFCGPDRSFPVPDCSHVVAARRLIGRYKGPGDKSKILACVSRKAKALGCGGASKKDEVQKTEVTSEVKQDNYSTAQALHMLVEVMESKAWSTTEEKSVPVLTDEEVKSLQGILKRLATLVGKDALVNVLVLENLALDPVCEDKLVDEIILHEETIGVLRDQLDALKKEYLVLSNDMNKLQDALVEQTKKARVVREAYLTILKALDEKNAEKTDWTQLTDEVLDSKLSELIGKVDINKIVSKIGDGMSRKPTELVNDPTVFQDEKKLAAPEELVQIQEYATQLLFGRGGQEAAQRYIRYCQSIGKLPVDYK